MKKMKNLTVVALTVAGALFIARYSSGAAGSQPTPTPTAETKADAKNVGIMIFNGLFITEFAAPFDVYKHTGDKMNVFTVGFTKDPIKTYEGVVLQPDFSMKDAPKIDIFVVPSGLESQAKDLENKDYMAFVAKTAQSATYATSHCWGAFTLAGAGCLKGLDCTTFPSSIDDLQKKFPDVKTHKDARFIVSGKFVTSNGGLAAFEAATYVVEHVLGKEAADKVADGLVFTKENRANSAGPAAH